MKGKGKGDEKGGFKGLLKGSFEQAKGKGKSDYGGSKGEQGHLKGNSKGSGKPMYGGCWHCGGGHFARDCPAKGGGWKGKGLRSIEEYSHADIYQPREWEHHGQARPLSCLKTMLPSSEVEFEVIDKNATEFEIVDDSQMEFETVDKNNVDFELVPECLIHDSKDMDHEEVANDFEVVVGRREQKKNKRKAKQQALRILQVIEPEGVNVIDTTGEWEEIDLAVDSGATETVINEDMLKSVDLKDGPASRRGVEYEVANGVRIPNLGEKKFVGVNEEGHERAITAQVCDVNKALLSVKKVLAAGNRVIFDEDGSFIEDKTTGERMWMRESNGMFMLRMWVKKAPGF